MSFNQELRRRVRNAAAGLQINQGAKSLAHRAHALTCDVLKDWGAVQPASAGALGLESFETEVVRVTNFDALQDADATKLMTGLRDSVKLADRHIEQVAEQCLELFDSKRTPMTILNQTPVSGNLAPMSTVVGRGMAAQLMSEDGIGMEAFGDDINRLSSDDRVTMTLTIMRPSENIMDKALARVSDSSPIVTIKVPAPEVFDWAKTQEANSTIASRHGPANSNKLRDLYRNPQPVNSAPKRIVALDANDSGDVLWNNTTQYYKTAKKAPILDLSRTGTNFTYDHIDRTDLVSDGAVVDAVIVTIVSGGNTEHFKLNTKVFEQAQFSISGSSKDSGQRQVILDGTFAITAGSVEFDNSASTIAAALTDAKVQIDFRLTATLNIKSGLLEGSGTVDLSLKQKADGTAISGATTTLFNGMVATLSAYSIEAYFDEENMRKANLSIQTNYYEQQFAVPRGRVYFADYSLSQEVDENNIATTSSVMALGNGRRGLDTIVSGLSEIAEGQKFAIDFPEVAAQNTIGEQSFAASLVKPTVVTSVLDFEDEELNVMNESTRLTEIHGRFRARLLSLATSLFAHSLMLNQYKAGERPVLKAWVHSTIADLVIGIVDYYPELSDKAATATGADYSMLLPNGYRLDVIKSNFDCLIQRMFIVPVIESDMTSILSAAQIRDCGMVSTNYIPTINGASMRRFATTTREIVMMSNKVGICLEVKGLQAQLGAIGHDPIELSPNYSVELAI